MQSAPAPARTTTASMDPPPKHRNHLAFDNVSPADGSALLASARALRCAAVAGPPSAPLRGKNLGLLCEVDADVDAALLRRAALELGAHVAQIRPSLTELSTHDEVRYTARLLGRLYDAVACQGLPLGLVQQISVEAGVPVFDGIASRSHPSAQLAALLADGVSADDAQRFVLQAMLLSVLG